MSMKDRIVPVPQKYTRLPGDAVVLGVPGKANFRIVNETCTACSAVCASAEKLLREKLGGLLGVCTCSADGEIVITLKIMAAPEGILNSAQGYSLLVTDRAVTVTGFGAEGLYYGVVTLTQCIALENGEAALEPCDILDWPELRTRGHFMESRFGSNLMTLDDWKAVVDHMAGMKQNQLVVSVYGCWCVQYDGRVSEYMYLPMRKYPKLKVPVVKRYWSPKRNAWVDEEQDVPMVKDDFFGDLIAYGKSKAVEVLPLFNSYGHNTLIPRNYPEVSAKDENGEPTLTGFCTRNPKTYEMMFNIYDEIIDHYLKPNGIESFHMGLDEVGAGLAQNAEDIFRNRNAVCKCPLCRDANKSDLYIEHAIKLMKHLKERGMKNIYMYHDMLIKVGDGEWHGAEDSTEKMMRAIEENGLRDVAVIDWWTYSDFQESLMFQTTHPEQGLRRTVKPWNGYYHWNIVSYPMKNVYLLGKMAHEEGCEGMQSYSAWDLSYDRIHVAQADYAWCFENAGDIDEVTRSYAKARFGAQAEKAERALKLFDKIMRQTPRADLWGDKQVPSNYTIMMSTLAYYFYSYVRAGKPYPRSFPGEAMAAMLPERESYESAILAIAAMARQAEGLWREIALDARVDTKMARRYAWEAAHAKTLAEDFLALFMLYDLYGGGHVCVSRAKKMAAIAGERKLARLTLMDEFERTKEEFLAASHMRNHSIYMQFFADLEAYLARTPANEITLDFTDFSPIASAQFMKLR